MDTALAAPAPQTLIPEPRTLSEKLATLPLKPLLMLGVASCLKPVPPPAAQGRLLDLRPVLKNRPTMGYILAYGAHCFELYGVRTWLVAFWTFVTLQHPGSGLPSPARF